MLYSNFPILLDNPLAWRTYLGGALIDELHNVKNTENAHFPEERIMSTTSDPNAGKNIFLARCEPPCKVKTTLRPLFDSSLINV